jgi:HK97 family phage prohead protease
MSEIEKRCYSAVELRVDETDGKNRITGLAVPYNQPSEMMWDFREIFKPGAFKESLTGDGDMFANVEHESRMKLGRRSVGTLEFQEKRDGLYATVTLPNTTLGRDTLEEVRGGLLDAMSIEFTEPTETFKGKGENIIREISKAKLLGVALTSFPAYRQTVGKLVERSLAEYRSTIETDESAEAKAAEEEAAKAEEDRVVELEQARGRLDIEEAML